MSSLPKKGGSKAPSEPMDWMANDASTSCLICSKLWSMKNRRHHCRRCGRLVCNECSMRSMTFDEGEEPKRICDDCYESVTRKQQVQMEVNYHREREMQLLHATSKVSDSLVRVYFLDGSFKTVFYDESTTSTEIASKLCFSVKIALFEVEKDLRNPNEYVLVPQDECIVNIIARWTINGQNHAKLIIPISDMNSVLKTQLHDRRSAPLGGTASTADHLAQAEREKDLKEAQRYNYGPGYRGSFRGSFAVVGDGATTRESVMDSPGKAGFSKKMSFGPGGGGGVVQSGSYRESVTQGGPNDVMGAIQELQEVYGKLDGLTQDNMRLMKEISDIKKKYDILRTIHTKTNKNTRELKKEMDGLKGGPEQARGSRAGSGERARQNSGVRSSFGLTGLTQTLTARPASTPMAGLGSSSGEWEAGRSPPVPPPPMHTPPPQERSFEEEEVEEPQQELQKPTAPNVLYKGSMLRRSTGVTKLFKPTFAVFTEEKLCFYADESMKKLDRSCLTIGAVAGVGAKDPAWFTITTPSEQIVLKTDSAVTSELLVSVINETAEAAREDERAAADTADEDDDEHAAEDPAGDVDAAEHEPVPLAPDKEEAAACENGHGPCMEAIPEETVDDDGPEDEPVGGDEPSVARAAVVPGEQPVGQREEPPAEAGSVPPVRDEEPATPEVVHYKGPVLRQRTGALGKKFKTNYIVFTDRALKFYTDETMKKLEKSLPALGSTSVVGPRDPLCLTITNGKLSFVIKTDSVDMPRRLEGIVNSLAHPPTTGAPKMSNAATTAPPAPLSDAPVMSTALVPQSPASFKRKNDVESGELVGTGDNASASISNKYEELKDIDSTYQVKVFLDKVAGIESFFRVFDDIMHTTLENGVRESQQVTHTYEIISAMQTLYAGILDYGENWTSVARDWLLRMLRQHMRLPVQEPEILMAVIQCISRENMMFSPDTSEVVNQIIEMSFEDISNDDPDFPSSTEGILAGVTRMVETLEQVVEDLVPLLPEDFNVITMYSAKANKKIKSDISTFYAANKDNITNREVLTLLSFADSQKYHLSKFGVDTSVVDTLQADLLQHYSTMVTTLMRQWIGRICDADEKAELQLAKGFNLGMTTHWPEDLLSCVGEQLNLAVNELKPSACERVCTLVLESLKVLTSRQKAWLGAKIKTLPPERLCAYVNNLDRFARHLSERGDEVVARLADSASAKLRTFSVDSVKPMVRKDSSEILSLSGKLDETFKGAVKTLVAESRVGLKELILLVCNDFKDGLAAGLFVEDWADSPQVMETLKTTLDDYVGDLSEWLASREDLDRVILGILRSVTYTYLEMLLTSNLLVTPRIADRLAQDVHVLLVSFSEFEEHIAEDVLDAEVHPLKCVTDLMAKDPRQMSKFVRDVMYPLFGNACMKIWQTAMQMRADVQGKSDVYFAMHDTIMLDWDPPFVKPACVISFQDKLKSVQKADHSKGRKTTKK